MQKTLKSLAHILGVLGFGMLLYTVQKITRKGLYMDAHNTGGPISVYEIILLSMAIFCITVSLTLFFKVLGGSDSKQTQMTRHTTRLTLLGLIFAAVGILIYWFAGIAIILGAYVIFLAHSQRNEHSQNLVSHTGMGAFIIVISITSILLTFTTR